MLPSVWFLMTWVPKITSQLQIEAEIWYNMIAKMGARLLKMKLMVIISLTNYDIALKPTPTPPNIWLLMILVPKMTSQLKIEAEIW